MEVMVGMERKRQRGSSPDTLKNELQAPGQRHGGVIETRHCEDLRPLLE